MWASYASAHVDWVVDRRTPFSMYLNTVTDVAAWHLELCSTSSGTTSRSFRSSSSVGVIASWLEEPGWHGHRPRPLASIEQTIAIILPNTQTKCPSVVRVVRWGLISTTTWFDFMTRDNLHRHSFNERNNVLSTAIRADIVRAKHRLLYPTCPQQIPSKSRSTSPNMVGGRRLSATVIGVCWDRAWACWDCCSVLLTRGRFGLRLDGSTYCCSPSSLSSTDNTANLLRVDGVDVDATNAQSGTVVFICWSAGWPSVADVELSLKLLRYAEFPAVGWRDGWAKSALGSGGNGSGGNRV